MAIRTQKTVVLTSRNNHDLPKTQGQITRVDFDKKERTENALKLFGILIGLTFAAIFVPLVHYVLVPGLFIASFVFAMDKLNETTRSEGGSAECPKCHGKVELVASKYNERMTDTCAACHEDVEIHVVDPTTHN